MLASLLHSKVARAPNSKGQPPSPGAWTTFSNLFGIRLAKCSDRANCQVPSTFTAKWLASWNVVMRVDDCRRLQSTSGGSSDTAEKELAVSPSSRPSVVREVVTVAPATDRPSVVG